MLRTAQIVAGEADAKKGQRNYPLPLLV